MQEPDNLNNTSRRPDDFLSGGGEMGERMRQFDWSKTPLGPVERWPQSLKTATRIMLTSRQPIWLGWGQDLIKLYNDAYKSIVGGKHPEALGQSTFVVWREILNEIGPMLETAMGGVEGTYVEEQLLIMERNGYPEETYYTFSYSPIPNDQGGVGGIICANTDETAKVLSARRLRTLRMLAEQVTQTKSAEEVCEIAAKNLEDNSYDLPFALLYLLDPASERAYLAGATRIAAATPASPKVSKIADGDAAIWPFRQVMDSGKGQIVTGLEARFGELPGGAWPESPKQAIALPLAKAGQESLAGFLVAGISPRLPFDDNYRGFIELTSGHIATAIANARAYEEEKKRAEALAELDQAKTAFFSNISHEFRTPLTLMLGPLETALSGPLDPQQREELEVVQRNGLRLQKLVNTLLDFSRIEAGRIQAIYEPTDLPGYTAELASVFRSAVERAGLQLIVDCPPLPEPIYIDREMWEKVVLNLLSNAFKFTFEGALTVSLRPAEGHVELRVTDTGTGIPAAELPHLFERFHRIRGAKARTHEGTGIGLALVQELVKLHGGNIAVESEVGKGTTFTVSIPTGSAHLPADRIDETRAAASALLRADAYVEEGAHWIPNESNVGSRTALAAEPLGWPQPAGDRSTRILLADDNADMREYVRRILGRHWTVETVPNGKAALEAARGQVPDLVLSDVMMPELDGFELLRELRSDLRTREVPVILLSARAGEESRIEGLEAGADDYLVKPFSARELLARVGAYLQLARLRRETQEQIRNILESITDGFLSLDSQWCYVYINVEAERMGFNRAELLGKKLWEVFPELIGTETETALRRAMDEQVAVEFEEHNERWERIYANKAYPSPNGGLTIYFRDITERKRAQERIAADLEAMTRLNEVGNLCARAEIEPQQCLDAIIAAAIAITGADKGTLQLLDPDSGALTIVAQQGFEEPFLKFFASVHDEASACGKAMRLAERVSIKDVTRSEIFAGQPALDVLLEAGVYAVQSTPLISSNGNLLGMISSHFRQPHRLSERELRLMDLLARQAADYLDRKQAEEILRASEAQLQTLLDAAPVGVYLLDEKFRIRQVNPRARPVFGDIPDLIGRDFDEVLHVLWPKQDADDFTRIFRHTLETGEPYFIPEYIKERLDSGVTEYYEWQINRIPLPEGGYGVVCYFRDISAQVLARLEREKLLSAEREARESADAASRAKDEFLATVSHELRTPLNAMLGWARLLSGGNLNDETAMRGLKSIEQNAKAQAQLIEDLLDVSRIISGKFRLNVEPIQVVRVIEAAVESVRPAADARGVRLQVTLDPNAGPVSGDAGRIQQVVWNLLSNAVKFTPRGGRVQAQLIRVNSHIEIVVSDTGQGITREFLPYVFDRFRQADGSSTRSYGGLGLGLAIVRHIVELHGGSVAADSPGNGQGSTFTVRLPLMVIHRKASGETRIHPRVENEIAMSFKPSPSLEGVNVLVVDDEPETLLLLSTVLTQCGANVKTASSAEEGFNQIKIWRPTVIVSDIGMPGEDGYAFMKRVRQWMRESGAWIPAVALTAYARAEDRMKALGAGYQIHVPKPVEPAELVTVIASLVERPALPWQPAP